MRSGMEFLGSEDVRLGCPLFLLERETVGELEPLLRDLRGGGYTSLSLRELFRCRRGLRSWPPRPCAVLLRGIPFDALRETLPLLAQWETPVNLFCTEPYGEREAELLRDSAWLQCYGDAEGKDFHVAAFCERMDARTAALLREKRIWMAVTASLQAGSAPGGVDLLYALPVERGNRLPELLARWHRAMTGQTEEAGLRLEEPKELRWDSAYDPSDGSYRLTFEPMADPLSQSEAKAWADEAGEEHPAGDGVLHGWSASVALANRVERGGQVSAASLRAFLEERLLCASRLRALCERENLYAEPTQRYLALLETEAKSVLRELQGPESLHPGLGVLFRRLLNAEEGCRRSLSEGLERMQALREFRAGKDGKKE